MRDTHLHFQVPWLHGEAPDGDLRLRTDGEPTMRPGELIHRMGAKPVARAAGAIEVKELGETTIRITKRITFAHAF